MPGSAGRGNPLWVAKEVCEILGLSNPTEAIKSLDDDEKMNIVISEFQSPGRGGDNGRRVIVNEPGLYQLIIRSSKSLAKAFKRWVIHGESFAIRKTAGYSTELR